LASKIVKPVTNDEDKEMKRIAAVSVLTLMALCLACTTQRNSYKSSVERGLQQADLRDVTVSEDTNKNTITLGGTLHSDDAKARAGDVAKANAGPRIIANEISVQPVGAESEARNEAAALDDGIEKNYKAALISGRLDKQHIDYNAKNGVLTLTGSVRTSHERQDAEQLAGKVPNVQQVVNQIDVKR
jgi:hyperosmotically inducible periplasmic protein